MKNQTGIDDCLRKFLVSLKSRHNFIELLLK